MTLEQQIEDLKAQVEATASKNKELLSELRIAKSKNKELDFDTYNKVLEENDTLKSQVSKLTNDLGLRTKEFENIANKLNEKEKYLDDLTLSNTIKEQFAKNNFNNEDFETVTAYLEKHFKLADGVVTAGGKDIDSFMSEYVSGKGKRYTLAPENTGGGATGSNGTGATVQKRSEMTHAQKGEFIKANGQEAYLKLPN